MYKRDAYVTVLFTYAAFLLCVMNYFYANFMCDEYLTLKDQTCKLIRLIRFLKIKVSILLLIF